MSRSSSKSKGLKFLRPVMGYILGTLSWVFGLHCLEAGAGGTVKISNKKWLFHCVKLLAWVIAVLLLCRFWPVYRDWLLAGTLEAITLALLVKAVIFLYIRIFWPSLLIHILPGTRTFLCPQCFQKKTFRFVPVSFRFGFFVTYLCRYCFCLVDGWGNQIMYPSSVSFRQASAFLPQLLVSSFGIMVLGWWGAEWIWQVL